MDNNINLDNLNNSNAAKGAAEKEAPKPKTEAVAEGKPKGKTEEKKSQNSLVKRFVKNDAKSIWNYLFTRVLDPTVRKLLYDLATNTIHMVLYEGTKKNNGRSSSITADQVSYRRYYDDPDDIPRPRSSSGSSSKWGFRPLSYSRREEAEKVLDRMCEILGTYRFVPVSDYYELSGIDEFPYTCNDYGWKNLDDAEIIPNDDPDDSNEWIIDLPKPRPKR